jgi:hypothetical protein
MKHVILSLKMKGDIISGQSLILWLIYCTQFLGEKISGTLLHAKFKVSPGAIAIAATIGLSQNRC